MSLKRVVLGTLGVLVFATAAFAERIDFSFVDGSWSWSGGAGSTLTATSSTVSACVLTGTVCGPSVTLDSITFTTGGASAGSGDILATFAAGGSIVVTSALCGGPCFVGTFAASAIGVGTDEGLSLTGPRITGTISPLLLVALGLDPTATQVMQGSLVAILTADGVSFESGGQGDLEVGSGNLVVTPIPEPASLALLGTGLIGLVSILRRKVTRSS